MHLVFNAFYNSVTFLFQQKTSIFSLAAPAAPQSNQPPIAEDTYKDLAVKGETMTL